MSLIRPRQRVLTALSPHQANSRYLIPARPVTKSVLPPVTQEAAWGVVREGTTPRYGYSDGSLSLAVGTLVPNIWGGGIEVIRLFVNATSNNLIINTLAGAAFPPPNNLGGWVRLDGRPAVYLAYDNVSVGTYFVNSPAEVSYVISRTGFTILVTPGAAP